MKFSNRSNLPDALFRAVQNDPYSKGDAAFSITELLGPPRIAALREKHADEIEEDVEERLYSLYGQIAHLILERANRNGIAEKRYFGVINGIRVSGQVDTLDLDGGTLSDWKFTTAWKFKANQPQPPEWVAQLNMQLELLRQNGMDAKGLQIVGLIRDHSKLEAKRSADYPRLPVVLMPIPIWSRATTVAYFRDRITLHQQARITLPQCTREERWSRPDTFAVAKEGAKRAVRVFDSFEEATFFAGTHKDYVVTERPGEDIRCENYCSVAEHCSQRKAALAVLNPAVNPTAVEAPREVTP